MTSNFDAEKLKKIFELVTDELTRRLPLALKTKELLISPRYRVVEKRMALAHLCTHAFKKKYTKKMHTGGVAKMEAEVGGA